MNKKKNFLRFLETAAFCVCLFAAVLAANKLVQRKASIKHLQPFFDHAQKYDVLFVGDSLVINGIFPMEMWEEYGIAGYNLASYGNTIPVTYWTLINALDYAAPKAVVIGIKDVDKHYKLSGSSSDLHTAFDGYPLSRNKILAIEDLTNDPRAVDDAGIRYMDMKSEYYFTLGKYHDRWSELTDDDFRPALNVQAGANMLAGVAEPQDYELIDEWEASEESGCGFVYLRRMIEECKSRGIHVLLVHLPYPASVKAQRNANAVISVAQEYEVDYVDFVSLDQVVDYAVDCRDSHSHLNASGAKKVSDYLARYLVDHYNLPDRRGDELYAHWYADYDAYIDYKRAFIKGQEELDHLLMLLHDQNFSVLAAVEPDAPIYEDEQLYLLMHNVVREHVFEADAFSKWSNALFPLEGLDHAAQSGALYLLAADRKEGEVLEWSAEDTTCQADFSFGQLTLDMENGTPSIALQKDGRVTWMPDLSGEASVHILVIDDRTGETVKEYAF